MKKKLLLVDDEELFLKSLKDGLNPLSEQLETDICYSVNEAIKKVIDTNYDLIITDIRMPQKSGIELLIYLKQKKFHGKVMVMSAYSTHDNSQNISSLGVVEVISKPFNLEWFKNMLMEHFAKEAEKKVTFESINLVTVMQILNLEKKTSTLQIEVDNKIGYIYFEDGEIIHAHYDDLEGEQAVMKLISLNGEDNIIAVKKIQDKVRRTIEIPFVRYMMYLLKSIDEIHHQQQKQTGIPKKDSTDNLDKKGMKIKNKMTENHDTQENKEENIAVTEILKSLSKVKGYLGAGIFTSQKEILEGLSDISEIYFEKAGSLIHNTLSNSRTMSNEVGFGNLDMILLYTKLGIIFAKCYDDGYLHFHIILVIKPDGNIAMAKIKLSNTVEELKKIL